jgi:hypothetical protein
MLYSKHCGHILCELEIVFMQKIGNNANSKSRKNVSREIAHSNYTFIVSPLPLVLSEYDYFFHSFVRQCTAVVKENVIN